ncbi:MAG TPA: hypothetical protein VHH36_04060, partial [Candidatus Thermoplasmatota archaeon]|nr:hypothetical protein [Candidatus Thermoplasmatota archaeon]
MLRVAIVAACLALAGCASQAPSGPAAPTAAAAPQADGTLALADCVQLHMYFPSPAASFEAFVPEGFSLVTSGPGGTTVDVRVEGTVCAEASEVWVEIPVAPPEALARQADLHTAPVVAYVASEDLAARYAEWGLGAFVANATIRLALDGAPAHLRVDAPGESYEWTPALQPLDGEFAAFTLARWIPIDGGVAGAQWRNHTASDHLGAGPVAMVHEGEGGSPPAAG